MATAAASTTHAITDEEVLLRFPDDFIDRDNIEHYRGLLQKKLLIARCQNDGYWIYPHRPLCPKDWSEDIKPTEVSGKGFVYMYTLIHQGEPIEGVEFPIPLAGIELAEQEGLRYLAVLVDVDRDKIEVGMPVELAWTGRKGVPAPVFRPAKR